MVASFTIFACLAVGLTCETLIVIQEELLHTGAAFSLLYKAVLTGAITGHALVGLEIEDELRVTESVYFN